MRFRMVVVLAAAYAGLAGAWAADDAGFAFKDEAGQYLDVLNAGKIAGRYMYAYDKAKLNDTYKPYLHVFDAEGKAPITKGVGGEFTHHRGILIGWMKMSFNGKTYDRWHMKGGEQIHQKFADQKADKDQAAFTSLVNWTDETGKAFIEEERTMTFRRAPAPAYVLIDFASKMKAPLGDVTLDGDPEHAGIQYRPANEVDRPATVYVFPKENAKPHNDVDYPWVGETYTLNGKKYSVVILNHPDNPKKTKFSAYRNYGRFGAFPVTTIKSGESFTFKYRFIVGEGDMPAADVIQAWSNQFTGLNEPAPKISVIPADQPKPAEPKKK